MSQHTSLALKITKPHSESLRSILLSNNVLLPECLPQIAKDSVILAVRGFGESTGDDLQYFSEDSPLWLDLQQKFPNEIEIVHDVTFKVKPGKKGHRGKTQQITVQWIKEHLQRLLGDEDRPLSVELWHNGLCVVNAGLETLPLDTQRNAASLVIQQAGDSNKLHTVAVPIGGHHGPFRIRNYQVLSSIKDEKTLENNKESTDHHSLDDSTHLLEASIKENGVLLHLNLGTVWYSKRLEQERQRIASLIGKEHREPEVSALSSSKEHLLCMFCGIGPFPLVLLKKAGRHIAHVHAVELNPASFQYAQRNVRENHMEKYVTLLQGDANELCRKFAADGLHFDRVVMPAPRCEDTSLLRSFIRSALLVSKPGTRIHFYDHLPSIEVQTRAKEICDNWCRDCNSEDLSSLRLLEVVVCGQQSPHNYRVCYDLVVEHR